MKLYHYSDGKKKAGRNPAMLGNCSGLSGDCSGLWGNCSGLSGDCSGLWGEIPNWRDTDIRKMMGSK